MAVLEAVFSSDQGFQQMRTVRHMIFVDYYGMTDFNRFSFLFGAIGVFYEARHSLLHFKCI